MRFNVKLYAGYILYFVCNNFLFVVCCLYVLIFCVRVFLFIACLYVPFVFLPATLINEFDYVGNNGNENVCFSFFYVAEQPKFGLGRLL